MNVRACRELSLALMSAVVLLVLAGTMSTGFSSYANDIQGPLSGDCDVCHEGGFDTLNSYGEAFASISTHGEDSPGAIAQLTSVDSDRDGYDNGFELEQGTYPGDAASKPAVPPPEGAVAAIKSPVDLAVFRVGADITFDGSDSSDEDGGLAGISEFRWNFPDGTSLTGVRVTYSFAEPGEHVVYLKITSGGLSDTTSITLRTFGEDTNYAPFAVISPDTATTVKVNTSLEFNASLSYDPNDDLDGSGTIDGSETDGLAYSWDFGDGESGQGVTTSHTYAAAGTYTVTLTVEDDGFGTDGSRLSGEVTLEVTVTRPIIEFLRFSLSFTDIKVGDPMVVYATFFNNGSADGEIIVTCYDDGEQVGGALTGIDVAKANFQRVVFKWFPEKGNHVATVRAEYDGATIEHTADYSVVEYEPENSLGIPGFPVEALVSACLAMALLARRRRLTGGKDRGGDCA